MICYCVLTGASLGETKPIGLVVWQLSQGIHSLSDVLILIVVMHRGQIGVLVVFFALGLGQGPCGESIGLEVVAVRAIRLPTIRACAWCIRWLQWCRHCRQNVA